MTLHSPARPIIKSPLMSVVSGSTAAPQFALGEYTGVTFDVDGGNNHGLWSNGQTIDVISIPALSVMRYALDGTLLTTFPLDPANAVPTGITGDANDTYRWVADFQTRQIFQYTRDFVSMGVAFTATLVTNVDDLAYDDGTERLYILSRGDSNVSQYGASGVLLGTLISQWPTSPLTTPRGIYYDGAHFWITDSTADVVGRFRPDGTFDDFVFPTAPIQAAPLGVTSDGTDLLTVGTASAAVHRWGYRPPVIAPTAAAPEEPPAASDPLEGMTPTRTLVQGASVSASTFNRNAPATFRARIATIGEGVIHEQGSTRGAATTVAGGNIRIIAYNSDTPFGELIIPAPSSPYLLDWTLDTVGKRTIAWINNQPAGAADWSNNSSSWSNANGGGYGTTGSTVSSALAMQTPFSGVLEPLEYYEGFVLPVAA